MGDPLKSLGYCKTNNLRETCEGRNIIKLVSQTVPTEESIILMRYWTLIGLLDNCVSTIGVSDQYPDKSKDLKCCFSRHVGYF